MNDPNIFRDAVCLVTGAASGLGAAVVRTLAGQGAIVAGIDIQEDLGKAVCNEVNAHFLVGDVSRQEDWQRIAARVNELGQLHYIHLNAGIQIAPPDAPLEDYRFENLQIERYRRMMGVNVDGVVFGLHALLPLLKPGAGIVVTSSLAGITPYAIDPLYAMSKHAVAGLVRSLAPTLAERGITINALCPGGIDTAIIPHEQRNPDANFMTTEHVAEEVLDLFTTHENGKTWAKVSQSKPAFIVRAPGDKGSSGKGSDSSH
jgi:NAD(P)-dependent dehydrogenase (short-subunit alcohol dehydrogenase family)